MMSDADIIAAEHIIVSAQYKSKDWTDKYLVPVEQYRALEQRLTEKEKIIKDLISDECELEEQFIRAGFSDYDTHGDYKGLAVQVEECLTVLAKQKDSIIQLRKEILYVNQEMTAILRRNQGGYAGIQTQFVK